MAVLALILLPAPRAMAQQAAPAPAPASADGVWEGVAQSGGQSVAFRLEIKGGGDRLQAAFLNGEERSPASSGSYHDGHLVLQFDYYLNRLDATIAGDRLTGTFGGYARTVTLAAQPARGRADAPANAASDAPPVAGDWEIAVPRRPKGEPAWKLQVEQHGAAVSAVILRIDGDTGRLYGSWQDGVFTLSRFTADGPEALQLKPQPDGTLLVVRGRGTPLVARRPALARSAGLAGPDDPAQHTALADPTRPLAFDFPDLAGRRVSNADPQFRNKVVVVTVGGSWCPNCHDEAPFLEQLYRKYQRKGLEVVELSFEEQAQLADPTRLRAFIARYRITYTVLLAGVPDDLNARLPQVVNLNCWPTTFFVGRDGLVKAIHAGFAGPATEENAALRQQTDALVQRLLAAP